MSNTHPVNLNPRNCQLSYRFLSDHERIMYVNATISKEKTINQYFQRMRSSLVVRASDCQCTSCNGPGFDPSIPQHSGIWRAADETVLNIVWKKPKKYFKKLFSTKRKQSITHIGCEGELLDSDGLYEGEAEGVGEVESHPEQVPEIVQPGHAVHLHKHDFRCYQSR